MREFHFDALLARSKYCVLTQKWRNLKNLQSKVRRAGASVDEMENLGMLVNFERRIH
jgi:ribosomal protein L32E